MDDALLIRPQTKPVIRVEIARSFAFKLNCAHYGGAPYESRDFFCSERAECAFEDAQDVSESLYQFCKAEVMRAVLEYVKELRKRSAA